MSNITSTNERKYNSNNEEHPRLDEPSHKSKSQSPLSSKTRVIEIPVQHYQTNTNSSHSPASTQPPLHNESAAAAAFPTFPAFNNSSLFDNYQSPFDLLSRRPLINRGAAAESSNANASSAHNTPFSAHYGGADADDFFNQSAERLFGRNSPLKDHLGPQRTRQASNSPARYGQPEHTSSSSPLNLNAPSGVNRQQSPLNVNTSSSSDSPKRFTSQTTIQPNHSPGSSATKISGVEIPITHVSSPKSQEKSSYSDFQHPKPTVPDNASSSSKQHSTTPTRNEPASSSSSKMGNSSTSTSSNKKPGAANYESSDFATPVNRPGGVGGNLPTATASQQPKTDEDKCNEIEAELNALESDVLTFAGTKTSDRSYLKLEEMLTRVLLRLDAIECGEERVKQTRKRLINYTHQLSDKLEARAIGNESKQSGGGGDNTSSSSGSENQPPASKRTKSPNEEGGESHQNGNDS